MFKWNIEKNKLLYKTRGITFDEVVQAISEGYGVSDVPHWNKKKYPKQRIMVVMINNYAYLVPYIRDGEDYFLKTIIPSRKANKRIEGKAMINSKNINQLNNEELKILDAYEKGKLNGNPVSGSMILAAKETMKKNKNINIRISENDLQSIKLLAAKEGMPYQTLIGSIIHKYAAGYL